MKIRWSPLSLDRVSEIARYIAYDDPSAATEWVDHLFNRVQQLESFPQSGSVVPETNRDDIRQLFFGNYRIIYRVGSEDIFVLMVRHIRQILPEDDMK